MGRISNMFGCSGPLFRVSAAAATFVFLSLLVATASPVVHEAIHADAQDHQHHCAITLLAHGQVDAPPVADARRDPPWAYVRVPAPILIPLYGTTCNLLPPGRAPPAAG